MKFTYKNKIKVEYSNIFPLRHLAVEQGRGADLHLASRGGEGGGGDPGEHPHHLIHLSPTGST